MMQRRVFLSVLGSLSLVAAAVAAILPRPAPELSFSLNDGQKVQLSQQKGKVVAVCFILTTCSHCQKTVGALTKLQQEMGPRGFQVISAAIERDAQTHLPEFLQQFKPNFPVGFTDAMTALNWMQHSPTVNSLMPMLAFVDRQGKIRAQYEGNDEKFFSDQQEQNIRGQVEALLKEAVRGGGPAKKTTPGSKAPGKKGS